MEFAPGPPIRVTPEPFLQFGHGRGESLPQNIVPGLPFRRVLIVPPGAVGDVHQLTHHLEPPRAALGPVVLGQVVVESGGQQVTPERAVQGSRWTLRIHLVIPALPQRAHLFQTRILQVQFHHQGHQESRAAVVIVRLDAGHVLHVQGLGALFDKVDNTSGPVSHGRPVKDAPGIVGSDHGVVGGHDVALWRVQDPGEFFKGNVPLPLIVVRPARNGYLSGVSGLADRDFPRRLISDVPVHVRVQEVLSRDVKETGGFPELLPIPGFVEAQDGLQGVGRFQRGPAQGQGVGRGEVQSGFLVEILKFAVDIADDGPVAGRADGDFHRATSGDADDLGAYVHVDPFAVHLVLVGVLRVDFLDVQVHHVRPDVGKAPCDAVVVADDDARRACEGKAHDIIRAGFGFRLAVQAHLVPDGRQLLPQMGVVGQDGLPRGGEVPGNGPTVGTQIQATCAQKRVHLPDGTSQVFGQSGHLGPVGRKGWRGFGGSF